MPREFALPLNHGHWWYCENADQRHNRIQPGQFYGGPVRAMPVLQALMEQIGIPENQYSFRHRRNFVPKHKGYPNHNVEIVFNRVQDAVLFKMSVPGEITRWSD